MAKKEEAADTIIMTLRLKSGAFNGQLEVSVNSTNEEISAYVKHWLEMMKVAVQAGRSK